MACLERGVLAIVGEVEELPGYLVVAVLVGEVSQDGQDEHRRRRRPALESEGREFADVASVVGE